MTDNILAINGRTPSIASDAWVAPTATVVGSATVGPGMGIFYSAVVRADAEDIVIGANSNIKDTAVITPTRDIRPELARTSVADTVPCSTAAPWMTEPLSV